MTTQFSEISRIPLATGSAHHRLDGGGVLPRLLPAHGEVGQGRRGEARRGRSRSGAASHGLSRQARRGRARLGLAGRGPLGLGMAGMGYKMDRKAICLPVHLLFQDLPIPTFKAPGVSL